MPWRVLAALVLGIAVGAAVALQRPAPESDSPRVAAVAPVPVLPTPVDSPPVASSPPDAGALPHLPSGFCPAPGEDPLPFARPGLSDYLNSQDHAFTDAMRAALANPEASPALGEAAQALSDPTQAESVFELLRPVPERLQNGLDLAVRALVRAAAVVVPSDPGRARRLAAAAAAEAPRDPVPHAMEAFADLQVGDTAAARDALRQAVAADPREPALALALAHLLEQTVHVDELRTVLDAYLALVPRDLAASQQRARVGVQVDIQRDYVWRTSEGVTLAAPSDLFDEQGTRDLLVEVARDLDDAAQLIGTPRRRELTVIVYPGHEELLAVSCVNAWSGALYDGTLRLVATAQKPPAVRHGELRHEVLHAQLTPHVPGAPFWFNEGLATYFGERDRRDLRAAEEQMRANRTCFPFSSLQGSFQPFQDPADAIRAYAQSLAMVELLVHRGGTTAVAEAVAALRRGVRGGALLETVLHRAITTDELLADMPAPASP